MMLPNFLIIGSQKAGTTSLYYALKEHPDVFVSPTKEVNFFFRDDFYHRGLDWYAKHFDEWNGEAAIGEASPGYIVEPNAPARIASALGQIKLILTVRNPVNRAYSQYWDNRRSLSEGRTFDELALGKLDTEWTRGQRGYFSRGLYIRYLERYLEFFDRDDILVLVLEDLSKERNQFYKKLFAHIGVDPSHEGPGMRKQYNVSSIPRNIIYKWLFERPMLASHLPGKARAVVLKGRRIDFKYPLMSANAMQRLNEFYAPYNEALRRLIGHPLTGWS